MRWSRAGATPIWVTLAVIVLGSVRAAGAAVAVQPTRGSLLYETDDPKRPLAELPLEETDVRARILGFVARVEVRQRFNNPFDSPLEAVYVFPLPDDAAVGEMSIQVGDRTIRGLVKSRADARALYERARKSGRTAALLDQERPNIFTQAVANIAPKKEVVVQIRYDVPLVFDGGSFEFRYPMVVGPRYIPGRKTGRRSGHGRADDTDRVPDGSRITPPVRTPGSGAGHDVTMVVTIDPGAPMTKVWSPTHQVALSPATEISPTAVKVTLPKGDRIPNKDFVVRYRLADSEPTLSVMAQHDGSSEGYVALMFAPPAVPVAGKGPGVELVFVIDTSARMAGEPMALAKRAVRHALRNLGARDSFRIIRFDDGVRALSERALTNTPKNLRRGLSYVNGLAASGGTEVAKGLREAFAGGRSGDRLRIVVLVSNGLVGDDDAVVDLVRARLPKATRLFTLGTGSSTNRSLLERAAAAGRGVARYVLLTESPEQAIADFYDRVRLPVVTDLAIDWRGLGVTDVSPARLPDLFAGHPLAVVGRFDKVARKTIRVTGRRAGKKVSYELPVRLVSTVPPATSADTGSGAHSRTSTGVAAGAIGRLWARARIRDLMATAAADSAARAEIARLGLRHQLVTRYTSYVAVGERVAGAGKGRKRFVIPVEMPEGVSYEAVFDSRLGSETVNTGGVVGGDGAAGEPRPTDLRSPTGKKGAFRDDDDADDAGEAEVAAVPPAEPGSAQVAQRVLFETSGVAGGSRWLYGVGLGAGFSSIADGESGGSLGLQLQIGRIVAPRWVVGGELGLMVPLFDASDSLWFSPLVQVRWAGLLRGRLQLVGGVGGALPSNSDPGLAYMGALELTLPAARRLAPGLQLRLDGAARPGEPDLQSVTLGVKLSF
jgi:Ca-activated chloride channel family protein